VSSFGPINQHFFKRISALASKKRSDQKKHFISLIRGYIT
jgi:hypothetical protein